MCILYVVSNKLLPYHNNNNNNNMYVKSSIQTSSIDYKKISI